MQMALHGKEGEEHKILKYTVIITYRYKCHNRQTENKSRKQQKRVRVIRGLYIFSSFPLLLVFVAGGLGFEFCVFVTGWRHALRSE